MSSNNGTPLRYPKAVGKRPPGLGWSFFDWFDDWQAPAPLARTSSMNNFWNSGVNMAYGRESAYNPVSSRVVSRSGGDSDRKPEGYRTRSWSLWGAPPATIGVEDYNRAKSMIDYGDIDGAKALLGDLFNDVMGAIVPGWDSRPDALKKIVVKPDPNKIISMAQRVAPNAGADIVRAANANGMQIYVNTAAGPVNVTPETAQLYYGNYQFLSRAQEGLAGFGSALSSPTMLLTIGGIGIGLYLILKR